MWFRCLHRDRRARKHPDAHFEFSLSCGRGVVPAAVGLKKGSNSKMNIPLLFGGVMSILAALLHIAIILGGSEWYRFFGAGQQMVILAEQGSWIPTVSTSGIFAVLFIWGIYAFSGSGLIKKLPLLKPALVIISAIYLIRGFLIIPAWIIKPELIDSLLIWSSLVCLIVGTAYAVGTRQAWTDISSK